MKSYTKVVWENGTWSSSFKFHPAVKVMEWPSKQQDTKQVCPKSDRIQSLKVKVQINAKIKENKW